MSRTRVAVIGTGLIGLLTTFRLSQAGYQVTLYGPRESVRASRGIRTIAVFHEKKAMVTWMQQSYMLWDKLAEDLGVPLIDVLMLEVMDNLAERRLQAATLDAAGVLYEETRFVGINHLNFPTLLSCNVSKLVNLDTVNERLWQKLSGEDSVVHIAEYVREIDASEPSLMKLSTERGSGIFDYAVCACGAFTGELQIVPRKLGLANLVGATAQPYFIIRKETSSPMVFVKDNTNTARYLPDVDQVGARVFFAGIGPKVLPGTNCPNIESQRELAARYLREHFHCYSDIDPEHLEPQHCWYVSHELSFPEIRNGRGHPRLKVCIPPIGSGVKLAPLVALHCLNGIVMDRSAG